MWKLEDQFRVGLPDVLYNMDGQVGLIELKYAAAWPKRESTPKWTGVTPNQLAHLREWAGDGAGLAWVLSGIGREWFLLPLRMVDLWPRSPAGVPGMDQAGYRWDAVAHGVVGKWGPLFRYLSETATPATV